MLLILHQGAIGDFMLTLSVAGAMREHLGSPPVEVIASAPSARWAAQHGLIDICHSPESVGLHTLFAPDTPLDDRLIRLLRRATAVASFLSEPSEPIHARLIAATSAHVLSIDPRPKPITLTHGIHITEQWTTDIRAQGLPIGGPIPVRPLAKGSGVFETLSRDPDHSTRNAAALGGSIQGLPTPSRAILLHPGSGGRNKCWPLPHFLALADALTRDGARIAWMLGPAECEPADDRFTAITERVGCVIDAPFSSCPAEHLIAEDDLCAAAARIYSFALYIGNDGGMSHVAAATGIPTLIIFTATDPRVWRPLGDNAKVIDGQAQSTSPHEVQAIARRMLEISADA